MILELYGLGESSKVYSIKVNDDDLLIIESEEACFKFCLANLMVLNT